MNKLAWMSGLSPKTIAFIEQGKNSPTLRNVVRLADALELSVPNLFARAEKLLSEEGHVKTKRPERPALEGLKHLRLKNTNLRQSWASSIGTSAPG